jgi:phage RecT family recombinase
MNQAAPANTTSAAVALPDNIGALMRMPDLGARLASIAPPGYDGSKLARELSATLRENSALRGVTVESLVIAVSRVASLGLSLAPALAESYLVPRKDRETGRMKASVLIGKNGWLRLARVAAGVVDVVAQVVHERDKFELRLGGGFHVEHSPYLGDDPGPIVCAYAIATFQNGATRGAHLTKQEIASARAAADKDSKAWVNWQDAMVCKVVTKRLARIIAGGHPLVLAAIAVDDHIERVDLPLIFPSLEAPAPEGPTFAELADRVNRVGNADELDAALAALNHLPEQQQVELRALIAQRREALSTPAP